MYTCMHVPLVGVSLVQCTLSLTAFSTTWTLYGHLWYIITITQQPSLHAIAIHHKDQHLAFRRMSNVTRAT